MTGEQPKLELCVSCLACNQKQEVSNSNTHVFIYTHPDHAKFSGVRFSCVDCLTTAYTFGLPFNIEGFVSKGAVYSESHFAEERISNAYWQMKGIRPPNLTDVNRQVEEFGKMLKKITFAKVARELFE